MKKTKTIIYGIGKYGKQYIDFCILYGVTELELVDSNPHYVVRNTVDLKYVVRMN